VEIINELILQAATSPWLYAVMLAVAVIDGFFPPVPSETLLVAAVAVSISTGGANLPLICAAAAIGAILGDNIAYAIGRTVGVRRFAWMRRPRVAAAIARAQSALDLGGAPLIIGARYIPVGRVAVNMSAGALGYPRRRFVLLTVVAGVTWALYSAAIGLLAGHWLAGQPLLSAVLGVAVALALGVVIDRVSSAVRRRRAPRELPDARESRTPDERRRARVAG